MGFSCTAVQTLLIRELLVAFFGNELVIGLILGCWFVAEAIGSGVLGQLAGRWQGRIFCFAGLQVLLALFLPICLYAANVSRGIAGAIPGEGVGLVPVGYTSLLILTPLALVDGALFSFGCAAYSYIVNEHLPGKRAYLLPAGHVYVCEAVGAIAGGVAFTYLFIPSLNSLGITLVLSSLNLFAAALLLVLRSPLTARQPFHQFPAVAIAILLVLEIACLLSPWAEALQHWLLDQQWAGHNLVYSQNSVYGNVAVTRAETQYTFYANGIPIMSAPVPDIVKGEEMVHLPLLFVNRVQRVLVLGGGLGGVLSELLKYPLERIDYAELDPLLIEAVRRFPTSLTEGELSDSRVRVETVDGRFLVRRMIWESTSRAEAGYDVVLIHMPYPSTLQINRLYTMEFFEMSRKVLSKGGIIVIGCPGSPGYLTPEMRSLNLMISDTLRQVFPHIRPVPGDQTLWLASYSLDLLAVPLETLVARWESRALETRLISPAHIRYKLDHSRLRWFQGILEQAREDDRWINRDMRPIGLLYGLLYWNVLFSPQTGKLLAASSQLKVWEMILPIAMGVLLFWGTIRLVGKWKKAVVPIVVITTGFAGMTADLIIVFAFQTLYGYVFSWVGLLISTFMAGAGLGGLIMTTRLPVIADQHRMLLRLEAALLFYWIALPFALSFLHSQASDPLVFSSTRWLLLLLNAMAGFLVGCQFPLANAIWSKGYHREGKVAGFLYACDLVGAFFGTVVIPVIAMPVFGVLQTCLLMAIVKAGTLMLVSVRSAHI